MREKNQLFFLSCRYKYIHKPTQDLITVCLQVSKSGIIMTENLTNYVSTFTRKQMDSEQDSEKQRNIKTNTEWSTPAYIHYG